MQSEQSGMKKVIIVEIICEYWQWCINYFMSFYLLSLAVNWRWFVSWVGLNDCLS